MFRHRGKTRTLAHNLRIASLLSGVAGMVNVAGFLAVQRLTTNVTGHFAFFIDEVFKLNFLQGFAYFLYIFCFLAGSFAASFIVELLYRRKRDYVYRIPVFIESALLFFVAWFGPVFIGTHPDLIAFLLLFAMGMQNSLVTTLSNAVVRTTHLTGLFTDLGIELSQLFFYTEKEQRTKLYASIRLRLTIIICFFSGGIMGGIFYSLIHLYVLILAGAALLLGITFDYFKLRVILIKRKRENKREHPLPS